MKKYFAIIALATLTLVACEKVQEFFDNSNDVTTIYAIAGADRTKTTIQGLNVLWRTGDALAVAADNTVVEFTLKDGGDGQSEAAFEGELQGKSLGEYAVYPFSGASVTGNSANVNYQTSWTYEETIVPMWGVKGLSGTYNFHNVGGAVLVKYVNVPTAANSMSFKLTSNNGITGTATVSNLDTTPSVSYTGVTGTNVQVDNIPANAGTVSVVIPVPAGTYDFSAVLYDGENVVPGTYKTASGVVITSNQISKFPDVTPVTPMISVSSDNPLAVVSTASSQTITYDINNVPTSHKASASADVNWITDLTVVDGTNVTFNVAQQPAGGVARPGHITLSYPGATPVVVTVNQDPAPVINVTSANPMYVVEEDGGAKSISYSISNPTTATLSASTSDSWITITDDSAVSFTVAYNTDAAPRTGTITLTYDGAEDVTVTVLQEGLIYTLDASTYNTGWTHANILTTTNPLHFGGTVSKDGDTIECSISSTSDIANGKNISRVVVSSGGTYASNPATVTISSLTITAHNTANGNAIETQKATENITNATVTLTNSGATSGTTWTEKYYKIVYVLQISKKNKNAYVEFNNAKFYGYNVL